MSTGIPCTNPLHSRRPDGRCRQCHLAAVKRHQRKCRQSYHQLADLRAALAAAGIKLSA